MITLYQATPLAQTLSTIQAQVAADGLPPLDIKLRKWDTEESNCNSDYTTYTLRFAVTNTTTVALNELVIQAYFLTKQGVIIAGTQETEGVNLLPGKTIRQKVYLDVHLSEMSPGDARDQILIDVTACAYGKCPLGEVEMPSENWVPVALPPTTLTAVSQLVGGSLWKDKAGEVVLAGLVHNFTPLFLPEVRLSGVITDKVGLKVADLDASGAIPPGGLITLYGGGSALPRCPDEAKVKLTLSGYWPVARGLVCGEMGYE